MRLLLIICFSVIFITDGLSQASWHYSVGFVVTNREGNDIDSNDLHSGKVRIYLMQESPALAYVGGLRLFNAYGVTHTGGLQIGCINGQDTTIVYLPHLGERLIITSWPKESGFYELGSSPNPSAVYSPLTSANGRYDLHTLSILDWSKFKVPTKKLKLKESILRMRLKTWDSK
jgi:hypothetical protein